MPVADIKARHDDGGILQLLRDIFGADEDLNGAVRIEPGGQVGERVFIQCAEHLLCLGQVLIFRLAQQAVLPGKVNFRAMSLSSTCVVKSTMTGTRLAAAPALRVTRFMTSGVKPEAGSR